MWKFSIIKAFKNNRLLSHLFGWFLAVILYLVFHKDDMRSVICILSLMMILIIWMGQKVLSMLHLLKTGYDIEGEILEVKRFMKGRAEMKIAYQVDGERIEKTLNVFSTSDTKKLEEMGRGTFCVSKKNKKRIIVKELYCSKL